MDSARILIAMNNDLSIGKMKNILVEAGFLVVDQARDGNECLRKIKTLKPDMVILDYNIPVVNGRDVAKAVLEDGICEVIVLTAPEFDDELKFLRSYCSFVSLIKPVNKATLLCACEIMIKNRKQIKQLEREIVELKSSLDARKEVERAKGLLMKNLGLSENDAFKRIQKQSMDRGIPMKEIAKAIILAYDI